MQEILRIIEKVLILYFTGYLVTDIFMYLYSLYAFFSRKPVKINKIDFTNHPISIIVPAYNEEVSIVTCTNLLSELDYPNFEVIIINDGSKDNTMQVLKDNYNLLEIDILHSEQIPTQKIKHFYQVKDKNILIIDKENG